MVHELKLASVNGNHKANVVLWSPTTSILVMLIAIPTVLCAILIANALIGGGPLAY